MLFQRLYNWIKYKTLPSSFLFKNRLFIERDSKHKRILSNFGLSFRNSKWTNYETYNIKSQFKNFYLRYIFWFLILIFSFYFILFFKKYYIFFYFFNNLSFFFWISIDTFDYYLSFLTWLVTIGFSLFFNLIYSYFFFNNFSKNIENKEIFSNNAFFNFSKNLNFNNKDLFVSKHDLNWILYSWLTNNKAKKNTKIIENLFDLNINQIVWNNYSNFFIKLYKLSFLLNLSSEKNSIFMLNNNIKNFLNIKFKGNYLNILFYFNNNSISNKYSNILFYYTLNNYTNYFNFKNSKSSSLSLLNNHFEWNLYNFNNELDKYPFLLKNKLGLFFFNDFNYKQFSYFIFNFEELWALNSYLKNQINAAKWNRWLYRYSILHRKILRNSHKITLSKKLINLNMYDLSIFNKNIWATEYLNKIDFQKNFNFFINNDRNNFSSQNYLFFNNKISLNNNGSQLNSLNLMNFYENSYFWYLKRFYLFNTLSNNFIKSKVNLINLNKFNDISTNKNNLNDKYFIFLNYLLNSFYINLSNYSHFSNSYGSFSNIYKNLNSDANFYNLKDLYLLNNENNLFNKNNLNILYWITLNSNKNNNLIFFNYLNLYKISKINNMSIFFLNSNKLTNKWLIYSLVNIDNFYLNDIAYLSLFF